MTNVLDRPADKSLLGFKGNLRTSSAKLGIKDGQPVKNPTRGETGTR